MHDLTRRTVLKGTTALAAASTLSASAFTDWAKAWA
jgi:TAT (twin-arginine translocation) pathway signal sequence